MKSKKKIILILISAVAIAVLLIAGAWMARYFMTGRTGNIAGIDWYNEEQKEFTLTTEDELYEFAELSYFYDFEGQTVKLGADIVVNEGDAEDWAKKAPKKKWFSIHGFAGTFDGQGYSISGLYSRMYDMEMGLFSDTKQGCVIRDFRLLNSYFNSSGNMGTASISSGGGGTFEKIYSDAIIESEGFYTAGILGQALTKTTISECWFDGSVTTQGRFSGGIVSNVDNTELLMEHCLNSGDITSSYTVKSATVGGLCGLSQTLGTFVEIKDSLNVGTITSDDKVRVGAVMGGVGTDTDVKMSSSFATTESYDVVIGLENGNLNGGIFQMEVDELKGTNAYRWTTLDFENYWNCIEEDTPVLSYFTEEKLSVEGVEKGYDISWYSEAATEYLITTREQLYGVALLSGNTNFAKKTIKLGNDIVINEGKAAEWSKDKPENSWFPILNFAGTFDGQGHSITGLYKHGKSLIGLFAKTTKNSVVKNLKLTNSYLCATSTGNAYVGSIVARGGGLFDTIYSDAIIETTGNFSGGIIGQMNINVSTNKIVNCWFDGSIKTSGRGSGGITSSVTGGMLTIEHCLNSGSIESTYEEGSARVGGICGIVMIEVGEGAILNITDSMNVGEITAKNKLHAGSILGRAANDTKLTLKDVYASKESCNATISSLAEKAQLSGVAYAVGERGLIGFGGYQRTSLDFANYWAVVLEGTPILKSFASRIPSIPKGLERTIVPDTSWYSAEKKSFTIKTGAELAGLAVLSSTDDFKGKTVKLGADITLNRGNATDWKTEEAITQWTTIGNTAKPFAGNFDGQGHTISGICYTGEDAVGLFGAMAVDATIQNFKLVNSYFCAIDDNGMTMGSIVARGGGQIDSVYSDAIMESKTASKEGKTDNHHVGGIIGLVDIIASKEKNQITNSWFDGSIDSSARQTGGIVGTVREGTDKSKTVGITIAHCLSSADKIRNTYAEGAARSGGILGFGYGAIGFVDIAVQDCLSISDMESVEQVYTCSALGRVTKNSRVQIDKVYVSKESCKKVNDNSSGTTTGEVAAVEIEGLKGYGAYQRTYLDFTKYWTVVLSPEISTPILQKFANEVPALTDIDRAVIADTSWYKENETLFVIDTVAKLYGFAELSKTKTFVGKTVKLGADMTVNSGSVEEFQKEAPINQWYSIGTIDNPFGGTFDGQGHTIRGIYCTGDDTIGFFGATAKSSVIRDFKLEQSYFASDDTNGLAIGSVVARGGGLLDTVYSSAKIKTTNGGDKAKVNDGHYVGGLIGLVDVIADKGINKITNCQFAGTIESAGRQIGGIVGAVRNRTENTTVDMMIEHCLNTANEMKSTYTTVKALRMGGLCGFVYGETGNTALSIKDCLNTCKLNVNVTGVGETNRIGAIVGALAGAYEASVTCSYAVAGTWDTVIDTKGSATLIDVKLIEENQLTGYGGYANTKLEFDNTETEAVNDGHWVAKPNGTPELRSFTDMNDIVNLVFVVPSIDWYTNATDDANDNQPGSAENPYVLNNAADLYGFEQLVNDGTLSNKDVVVTLGASFSVNDGNAAEWLSKPPINGWTPIGKSADKAFTGTFDGKGNTISGIYCVGEDVVGLFGVTTADTIIKNLLVDNSCFASSDTTGLTIGSVVARGGGSIESVYSNAMIVTTNGTSTKDMVDGHYVGGIIGLVDANVENQTTRVSNCWFEGSIESVGRQIGGIVGAVRNKTENTTVALLLEHCLNMASNMKSTYTTVSALRMGGLCGFVYGESGKAQLSVEDSINTCKLTINVTGVGQTNRIGAVVGALAGSYSAEINNSYALKGTWSSAIDTTKTATVTETTNGTSVTITNYNELLVSADHLKNKQLDSTYWDLTTSAPVLKYKGVEVMNQER